MTVAPGFEFFVWAQVNSMKSLIFKVSTVLVTVVSVTLMAAALSVYFAHPDATSEMNTLAMLNYDFQQSTGENPMWTVKRRFSVVAADSKEPRHSRIL